MQIQGFFSYYTLLGAGHAQLLISGIYLGDFVWHDDDEEIKQKKWSHTFLRYIIHLVL